MLAKYVVLMHKKIPLNKEEWRHLKNTLELNYKNKVLFSLAMPQ